MQKLEDKLREQNLVSIEERWEDVKSKNECFTSENAPYLEVISDRSQKNVYEMIQKELIEAKEKERKAQEAEQRRLRRKEREHFRNLLNELVEQKKLHGRTKLPQVEPLMQEDERYKTLLEYQKDRVSDLFDAYMTLLKDQLYDDKKVLKTFFKVCFYLCFCVFHSFCLNSESCLVRVECV